MADRVGGKYILIGGLVLFATGMGYVDWIAEVNSGRWSFLPGLIVAGVGLGFTWTPLYNIAMRDVQPRVTRIAAGVFNTIQELGGVIVGAAVGALLQGRLAAAIQDEATRRVGQLPSEFCDWFLDGFRQGTRGGLEFGTNQAGGGVQATPGIPARVAEQLAEEVFKNAFVEAMHLTLILSIAVVLLAVISCFAVRQGKVKTRPESMEQVEDAA
jgi:MFS family permease